MPESAHLKIVSESEKYMNDETPAGEFLFKLMMQNAVIDTRETATYLRDNLTNLDTCMYTVNSDIDTFNWYVKVNVDGLKTRGDCTEDLVINLFKDYQVASDG